MRSLPPLLVPGGALPRLMAFYTATWMLGLIVGPASSGFLYDVDTTLPYVVSASGFIIAAATIMAVRVLHHQERTPSDQRATLHHALEGLRFVRRQRVLLGAIGLDMFAVLFGGAVALLPAIAEDRLGVGNVGYGWLRAAPGIGGASLTALMAIRPVGRHIGRTLFIVVGIFGAATMVFGWTHNYAVAFVALVVLSGADAVSVYIRATLVPLATPDHMRGRVMAVENVFIGASNELGAFESGVAAQLIGVGPAVMLGGLMTLAVVGVFSIRFVELRRIDTFGEIYAAGEVETIRARPG
jgi:predicted MFS family arabinose efflux permease